jgi:hypothetical protein
MAVGDLVGTLAVAGLSNPTFTLVSNPGGFFVVSGSNLLEAINTPVGSYPIILEAVSAGVTVIQSFVATFSASGTDGPMDFSVPGNIGITGALP